MALSAAERQRLIEQYARGPDRLSAALAAVPAEARQWRPGPGECTAHLLRRLPGEAWARAGRHTASGRYTAEDWLRIYAEHLEVHARQIEASLAAWRAR